MTDRHRLNEATCPVPLELLALLLRSSSARIAEVALSLPMPKRASLAAFCYSRCHMRSLGIEIGSHCDERPLRAAAGWAGEILFEQSRQRIRIDAWPAPVDKRKVSLARVAA